MDHVEGGRGYKAVCFLGMLALMLYPLRHVGLGVDLWDGGYNYANFRYCSLEHMDSMWYFATWIANHVGSLLMKLPFGDTMLGMNLYTGLIVSFLALFSWLFCVRAIHMPTWLAFLGEMLAVSLCWAPTAVLYNYLTYMLLLVGTCLLYQGLVAGNRRYLAAAGMALGLNVGVRLPNLVQMGLIVAVWFYGFCCKRKLSEVLKDTGVCILGYVGALGCFLLLIAVKYGFSNYMDAIMRLFQMTEDAVDYTPAYMLKSIARAYFDDESTYWTKRFLLMLGGGLAACLAFPKKWVRAKKISTVFITLTVMIWCMTHKFYSRDCTFYSAIYMPYIMVSEMLILLAFAELFRRSAHKEERLFALLMLLTIPITVIGSNNAMFSNINNMFLAAPGFLWMAWKFCRDRKEILFFPFKCVLFAGTFFLMIQGIRFGITFVYEQADGGRGMTARVEEIPVLRGMVTGEEKVSWLTGLYQYIDENALSQRKCILYGNIPGTAYYMGLKPAFNIWSDLPSYNPETMKADFARLEQELAGGGEMPLVILESACAGYLETGEESGMPDGTSAREKLSLICDFMERHGYKRTYGNDKFIVYE